MSEGYQVQFSDESLISLKRLEKPVARRLPAAPFLAWLLAGLWLALIAVLLLTPGDNPRWEDAHRRTGSTELTDSLGHLVIFAVLAALLANALAQHWPARRAVRATLALGLAIEVAQHWIPERGFTLYDLAANWLGALLVLWLWRRGRAPSSA
jgi:VanZ family protein